MLRLLTRTCLVLLASSALAEARGKDSKQDDDVAVSDDDSDDDAKPVKKKKHKDADDEDQPKAKKKKAVDDDSDEAPKTKKKKAKASDDDDADKPKAKKKKASDDDGDEPKKKAKASDDDDEPKAKKKKAKASDDDDEPKAKKKKAKASDDDDEPKAKKKKAKASDDDDEPKAKKKKKKRASDDDDEDKPAKKSKQPADADDDAGGRPFAKQAEKLDDDADDKPAKKTKTDARSKKSKQSKRDDDEAAVKKPKDDDFDPLATKKDSKAKKSKADANEIEMDEAPPAEPAARQDDAPPLGPDAVVAQAPVVANPLAINERPLTLPKDRLEVHGGFPITVLSVPGAMAGMTTTTTSEGFVVGVTYGAGDKAEVGADYTLSLNPGRIKGPFAIHGAYRVKQTPKLDVTLAAALAIDFIDVTDPVAMTTSSTTSFGLQLGAWARYRLTPIVSLFSGLPALPSSSPSLSKLAFPLPPQASQLVIGFNNGGAVALELPIGVGVQIKPQIYAFASTNLANIRIANTANAFLFKDFIPIALGGFYSLPQLDVGAVFADDLEQAAGNLRFELLARYAIK